VLINSPNVLPSLLIQLVRAANMVGGVDDDFIIIAITLNSIRTM